MGSLNLLLRRVRLKPGLRWSNIQQSQIDDVAGGGRASPLFPGAMLFNQIMVFADGKHKSDGANPLVPETLDPVYEYCSNTTIVNIVTDALIIDAEQVVPIECLSAINKLVKNEPSISRILLLGNELGYLQEQLITDKPVTVLTPDWADPSALHRIYRQARHTIFVDTLRAMDAAYTCCRCSVIFSTEKLKVPAASFWVKCLTEMSVCSVVDANGDVIPAGAECSYPFSIVENDRSELLKAIRENGGETGDARFPDIENNSDNRKYCATSHWLDQLDTSVPVIRPADSGSSWRHLNIRDRKTAATRKLAKLRHDPYAFFSDSKFNLLQHAAKLFAPERKAG